MAWKDHKPFIICMDHRRGDGTACTSFDMLLEMSVSAFSVLADSLCASDASSCHLDAHAAGAMVSYNISCGITAPAGANGSDLL